MLDTPSAPRARECLRFLLKHPGSSNREVAIGIDIAHQSQISRLLSLLVREGLVLKRSEGAGKRNAWLLTPRGEEIARALPER
jgi:DNA-binding IclR family transcriptional regulator